MYPHQVPWPVDQAWPKRHCCPGPGILSGGVVQRESLTPSPWPRLAETAAVLKSSHRVVDLAQDPGYDWPRFWLPASFGSWPFLEFSLPPICQF